MQDSLSQHLLSDPEHLRVGYEAGVLAGGGITDSVVHHRLTQLDEQFIKHRIALLERVDLTTARIERLKARLIDLLRAYVVSTLEIRRGEAIFRARTHREDE